MQELLSQTSILLSRHSELWFWLVALSSLTFISTLVIIPLLILQIPPDHFASEQPRPSRWARYHPVLRLLLLGRNLLGILLILIGIALLVLPGQGILSIVFGIFLLDFPGRYRFKRWMIQRPSILRTVNWLRRRYSRPPLRFQEAD